MTELKGKRFKTSGPVDSSAGRSHTDRKPRFKQPDEQFTTPAQPVERDIQIPAVVSSDEPFKVSPELSGSLPKLDAGEGAVVANRTNAASITGSFPAVDVRKAGVPKRSSAGATPSQQPRSFKKVALLIAGFVLVFMGIMHLMFSSPSDEINNIVNQETEQRVKVAQDGEVEYRDFIFSLSESKGTWELIGRPKNGEGEIRKYLTFEGTPVSLILFEGGFIIPENLSNGTWDVVTYTVSDGSVVSKLQDMSGQPVSGSGKLVQAEVSGDALNMKLESGETKSVNLK